MSIECPRCKAQNPDGKRFCGECGGLLDPAFDTIKGSLDALVRDQVRRVLDEKYKDQKVLEVEIAQSVGARLSEWGKLLAFFVGIPITILLLILGLLGFKTYSDFSSHVAAYATKAQSDVAAYATKAQSDMAAQIEAAQTGATKLKGDADRLAEEYKKLEARFSDTAALAKRVEVLANKVDVIGEKLGFTPTSSVSPETKKQLESAFEKFKQYLHGLGYKATGEVVEIDVPEKMTGGMIAYYDPGKRRMVIESKYVSEPAVLYREYMHHVLYPLGVPDGPEDQRWTYYAIESALAWYFACSFVDDPRPARAAAAWDLTKKRQFAELKPTISSAMIDGTEIWGGAFWEMREKLKKEAADRLLFEAWFKLRPDEVRTDRGANFVRKLLDLDKKNQAQIQEIFTGRGLTL